MTTIAVKDGIMAADSRCTDDLGAFATRMIKVFRLDSKALLGCAGDADFRDVVTLFNKASAKKLPTRAELAAIKTEFQGLLLFPNGTLFFIDITPGEGSSSEYKGSVVECRERFAAVGSGQQFAMGAMAAGRGAKQAIEIACRYDIHSGPPVVEYPVKPVSKSK